MKSLIAAGIALTAVATPALAQQVQPFDMGRMCFAQSQREIELYNRFAVPCSRGRIDDCKRILRRMRERTPRQRQCKAHMWSALASAHLKRRNNRSAAHWAKRAFDRWPHFRGAYLLTIATANQQKYAEAMKAGKMAKISAGGTKQEYAQIDRIIARSQAALQAAFKRQEDLKRQQLIADQERRRQQVEARERAAEQRRQAREAQRQARIAAHNARVQAETQRVRGVERSIDQKRPETWDKLMAELKRRKMKTPMCVFNCSPVKLEDLRELMQAHYDTNKRLRTWLVRGIVKLDEKWGDNRMYDYQVLVLYVREARFTYRVSANRYIYKGTLELKKREITLTKTRRGYERRGSFGVFVDPPKGCKLCRKEDTL